MEKSPNLIGSHISESHRTEILGVLEGFHGTLVGLLQRGGIPDWSETAEAFYRGGYSVDFRYVVPFVVLYLLEYYDKRNSQDVRRMYDYIDIMGCGKLLENFEQVVAGGRGNLATQGKERELVQNETGDKTPSKDTTGRNSSQATNPQRITADPTSSARVASKPTRMSGKTRPRKKKIERLTYQNRYFSARHVRILTDRNWTALAQFWEEFSATEEGNLKEGYLLPNRSPFIDAEESYVRDLVKQNMFTFLRNSEDEDESEPLHLDEMLRAEIQRVCAGKNLEPRVLPSLLQKSAIIELRKEILDIIEHKRNAEKVLDTRHDSGKLGSTKGL